MYTENDLLPVSHIQHLLFCERRVALLQTEGLWADNLFTAEGSQLHQKADTDLSLESRGDLRISRGLMLRSLKLGLIGKADVVEFHRVREGEDTPASGMATAIPLAGATGLWLPFPVEYKRGRLRHEESFEAQLCAQAICLEEMLQVGIPQGAIFYGKNRRRKQIRFTEELRGLTIDAASRLHEIISSGITPRARHEKKCLSCSLVNLCLPKVTGVDRSVSRYLSLALAEPKA